MSVRGKGVGQGAESGDLREFSASVWGENIPPTPCCLSVYMVVSLLSSYTPGESEILVSFVINVFRSS